MGWAVRRQIRTAQHLVLSSPTEAIAILGQAADKTVDGENITCGRRRTLNHDGTNRGR